MTNVRIFGLVLLLASLGVGCGRTASDTDAIRGAINNHLAGRGNLNTSAFDMEIQKVDIQGDQATVDVAFHVKDGPGMMQLTYNLKKTGANWAVVESNPVGSNFTHPALDGTGGPAPVSAPGAPTDIMDAIHNKLAAPAK
jgi:hypothetical protein